jgi:hypothetical protein
MRVFRRDDVAAVRLTSSAGSVPRTLSIAHVDLYFFYDVDIVLLNVELAADELPLHQAQEMLYRMGRAYPAGWDPAGQALHSMHSVEWLDAAGAACATGGLGSVEARHVLLGASSPAAGLAGDACARRGPRDEALARIHFARALDADGEPATAQAQIGLASRLLDAQHADSPMRVLLNSRSITNRYS